MLYILIMYYFLLKIYKINKLFLQDKYIAIVIELCYNMFVIIFSIRKEVFYAGKLYHKSGYRSR